MTSALTNQQQVIVFANSKQQFAEQLIWWRHLLVRVETRCCCCINWVTTDTTSSLNQLCCLLSRIQAYVFLCIWFCWLRFVKQNCKKCMPFQKRVAPWCVSAYLNPFLSIIVKEIGLMDLFSFELLISWLLLDNGHSFRIFNE